VGQLAGGDAVGTLNQFLNFLFEKWLWCAEGLSTLIVGGLPCAAAPVRVLRQNVPAVQIGAYSDDVNGPFRREVNKVGAKRRWHLQ
jgi:hypothetical protein